MRATHTYANLELTRPAFAEIKQKLEQAGYADQFIEDEGGLRIPMQGIAVTAEPEGGGTLDPFTHKPDGAARHPSVGGVLKFFKFSHLPPHLRETSEAIAVLAFDMADTLPENPELTVGLRKLLEAKDCLVRAKLP